MSNSSDFWIENGVLRKYKGTSRVVYIPKGVARIGDHAFNGCKNITSIVIPNGVTHIGVKDGLQFGNCGAFKDCNNLTSINIPD